MVPTVQSSICRTNDLAACVCVSMRYVNAWLNVVLNIQYVRCVFVYVFFCLSLRFVYSVILVFRSLQFYSEQTFQLFIVYSTKYKHCVTNSIGKHICICMYSVWAHDLKTCFHFVYSFPINEISHRCLLLFSRMCAFAHTNRLKHK